MKKRLMPRPCELLIQSALAVAACSAESTPSDAPPALEDLELTLDCEDEQTLRRVSNAMTSTLSTMRPMEQTNAVCALASDSRSEMRVLAALCLDQPHAIVGGQWCLDALSEDREGEVRRACELASTLSRKS